jgi:hypothetical protein
MGDLPSLLREMKQVIAAYPQGPERDQLQGRFDRACDRLRELPARVALRAQLKSRDEVFAVLTEECAYVVAALDGTN